MAEWETLEQTTYENLLSMVQESTGRQLSQDERNAIARGADEIDLVNSGLQETMITSYQQIRETMKSNPAIPDLRTAAFVSRHRQGRELL